MAAQKVPDTESTAHIPRRRGIPFSWIWTVLIAGFTLFSLAPSLYEISRMGDVQPDRQYELVHNFYTDYNFYLSRIREGLEGRWTVVEKYTSEPHSGSLIHEMYLFMGRVGSMVHVPAGNAGDVYHAARVVLAVTLLALIAAFSRHIWGGVSANGKKGFTGWAVVAFLFAITASTWPTLVSVVNTNVVPATPENVTGWRFGGYMSWWSVMDSLQRITFIPHLLAGQALMVFLVMALTSPQTLKRTGNIVFLGALAFLLGMVLPPGLLFVYGVVGMYGLLDLARTKKIRWSIWLSWGAVVLISAASLLYLALMTSVYPWKRLTELDVLHPLPFDYIEYFKAVGPVLPLGIAGLVLALVSQDMALYPAVAWVLAWLFFLGAFKFVPQQSPLRFSEMVPHVPLGILTAYLFFRLRTVRYVRGASTFVVFALIMLGLLQMCSSYLWQKDFVDHKIRATYPLVPTGSYVMYPLKDFVMAMKYLESATPRTAIVVSETTAGNYMPVYSGNTAYVGHDNTVNAEIKKMQVSKFFSGQMTPDEARSWLVSIPSRSVFFGPQEREEAGGKNLHDIYPFLSPVYTNASVTIYSVR